tara:strand:+ start:764 stop:919 length:156 start_codon:yes stop_codon:yes gene_type:complete
MVERKKYLDHNWTWEKVYELKKKTRHSGDESTVGFWIYMKALYKEKYYNDI